MLCTNYPEIDFFWNHIGGGPELYKIQRIVRENAKLSSMVVLNGYLVPHQSVIDHYRSNCVDLVVNTSSSEGTPVSLMEAACFGVPIMATNVGGNLDIVKATGGFLLSANPSPHEIAMQISSFAMLNNEEKIRYRVAARSGWQQSYSAEINYKDLAKLI